MEDDNPNSSTYGEMLNAPLLSSSNEPSTGTYVIGQIVWNSSPTSASGVFGWQRLTTGSGNVSGTDWMPLTSFDGLQHQQHDGEPFV